MTSYAANLTGTEKVKLKFSCRECVGGRGEMKLEVVITEQNRKKDRITEQVVCLLCRSVVLTELGMSLNWLIVSSEVDFTEKVSNIWKKRNLTKHIHGICWDCRLLVGLLTLLLLCCYSCTVLRITRLLLSSAQLKLSFILSSQHNIHPCHSSRLNTSGYITRQTKQCSHENFKNISRM